MNLMRGIGVAPGITVAVKELPKMDTQFIARHYLAGYAILRRCTHSGPGIVGVREYWTIETNFHGMDPSEVIRGRDCDWADFTDWLTLDAALSGLSVLGAIWAAEHPLLAYQEMQKELAR